MRLSYAVRLEDFRASQTPFVLRAGRNPGFKGVLVACGLIALLGVFCLVEGFGVLVAAFLIGLGFIAAGPAYLYDKHSVSKAKEAYEKRVLTGYKQLHCSDHRIFEADGRTFSAICKCGTVSRPWGELIQLSENENFFSLSTKSGAIVIPKSAFPTESEITQFRALATSKLNNEKTVTSRHFDFTCTRKDLRAAQILHALKGGGWRAVLNQVLTFVCVSGGFIVIWRGLASTHSGARFGLVGGALAVVLLRLSRGRPKQRQLPLRVYFGEEGLHFQNQTTQSRAPWTQFIGYLEDNRLLLLYSNPRLYRLIPKRTLIGQGTEFERLVRTKLPKYDYRNSGAADLLASASGQKPQVASSR